MQKKNINYKDSTCIPETTILSKINNKKSKT